MEIPRVVIAGTKSKVGKTMVAVGLMKALSERGYIVQPYKIGPDFIDPSFHNIATGRQSRNLDSFMLGRESIISTFYKNFKGADIAVIEGKTGLYDSADAISEKGSVAEVSKMLNSPVILVVDAERITRSIAALVLGYKVFDKSVDIRGVILNKAGGERHREKIKNAVVKLSKLDVLGIIPRMEIKMPYRHLGLVTAYERLDVHNLIENLARIIEKYVDVEKIIEIAHTAPPIETELEGEEEEYKKDLRIGVIRDQVFSFYYQDNIDELSKHSEIVYLNSLKDRDVSNLDALYIGGGFPEVFSEELEKNRRFREKIYEFCSSGMPVYAECGGLMFLGESIEVGGSEYEMVGFLPLKTVMHEKFWAQGYCIYKALRDSLVAKRNQILVGHEFHYSEPKLLRKVNFAFAVERGRGIDGQYDGIVLENTLASYLHLHFLSNKKIVVRFLNQIKKIKEES